MKLKITPKILLQACILAFAVFGVICACVLIYGAVFKKPKVRLFVEEAPDFSVELLTVNEYSRPATPTEEIKNIVVHYTANPGSSAEQNRNYFEGLKDSGETHASSHFIIGLEGEIIQCIPTAEMCYASNERNIDTVSIEVCHPDESGEFTAATYESLVHTCAWLCGKFELEPTDVIRHFDVSGKNCPKYFVENEEAWTSFISDIDTYINEHGTEVIIEEE